MSDKLNVIFICSGNSCRSQMAEGWAHHLRSDRFRAFSAGTDPRSRVDPVSIQVMKEAGVNIAHQKPTRSRPFSYRISIWLSPCVMTRRNPVRRFHPE
jgi:arsenate reductase (thioredoxin)